MSRAVDPPKFWHCAGCGTPNPAAAYVASCVGCGSPRPREANPAFCPDPNIVRSAVQATPARPRPVVLLALTWAYAAVLLLVLGTMRWLGESWWPGLALLYMPRLLWLVPVILLALGNLRKRSLSLGLLHLTLTGIVLGPLMGFQLPIGQAEAKEGLTLRIMTLNRGPANGLDSRRLIELIERERIDLICFQEGSRKRPLVNDELEAYFNESWHLDERKFLASRFPIELGLQPPSVEVEDKKFVAAYIHRVDLRLPDGRQMRLASAHLPTVQWTLQWLGEGDWDRAARHQEWRAEQVLKLLTLAGEDTEAPVLLAGDLNTPADSDLLDPFRTLYRFAFEEAGWGYGYTRPTFFPWIKIDHILVSAEWSVSRCWVGTDVGSDHLPVIAEVVLPPPPPKP